MDILKAIIPIIINKDVPEHIGSGILLKIKDKTFILTAAHVADDTISRELLIPTKEGLLPFQGTLAVFPLMINETRDEDTIDIAHYKFNENWEKDYKLEYEPLDYIDINITDIAYETDEYSFIGFPHRKSKTDNNNFNGKLYEYSGGYISNKDYGKYGFNPESNIVIHFDRKKFKPQKNDYNILPLPHGISGGGIFAHPKDKSQNKNNKLKLVGIAHTYLESKKIMIGTSINFLLSSILQNNSDLFEDIDDLKMNINSMKTLPMILGFAYYKKEQWNQIRNIMNDKEIMAEDWETWRLTLERGLTDRFNKGFQVIRIILDINELLEYSTKNRKPLNGKTRTALVAKKLADIYFRKEIKIIKEDIK